MVYDREGRKLWIVEDTGRHTPVGSWEEVDKRPRRADLPDWWLVRHGHQARLRRQVPGGVRHGHRQVCRQRWWNWRRRRQFPRGRRRWRRADQDQERTGKDEHPGQDRKRAAQVVQGRRGGQDTATAKVA